MGAGSVLRPPVRPILRPGDLRTPRIRPSSDSSSSSSSSSSLPPASASFLAGVRSQSTGEPARQVFGPVPSEPEAEAALTSLMHGFTQISHAGTHGDSQPSRVEQGNPQGTTVPSNRVRAELNAGNGSRSNGLRLSASTSRGLDRIRNSFDLLNRNPSIKKVVISLSTDKAVWEAIMKNEAVQELRKCLIQVGRNEPLAFVGEGDSVPRILKWIFDTSKIKVVEKIVELINQISDLVGALFRSRGSDETMEILNDVIKSSFMLSVMVLIIVIISRLQAESNQ